MTDKKYLSSPLPFSLLAVFTAANGLICAPSPCGSLWGFSAALLSGVGLLPLLYKLLEKISAGGGAAYKALLLISAIAALLPAISAAAEYSRFVYRAVLPHGDMGLIAAAFIICALYLASSRELTVYKFGFLSFVLALFVFALLFLMSAKTFDFRNLAAAFDISRFTFKDYGLCLFNFVLPSAAAVLFFRTSDKKIKPSAVLCGAAAGAALCLTAVFDSVLSFGLPLAGKLYYPYIDDISTVTAGSLFTRMDAFAYFAFFAAYVLKAAVCVKVSARLIRRAGFFG